METIRSNWCHYHPIESLGKTTRHTELTCIETKKSLIQQTVISWHVRIVAPIPKIQKKKKDKTNHVSHVTWNPAYRRSINSKVLGIVTPIPKRRKQVLQLSKLIILVCCYEQTIFFLLLNVVVVVVDVVIVIVILLLL